MMKRVLGFVFHSTRHSDGNIDIEFFDFENNEKVDYSTTDGMPKELAIALADSLGRNIWTRIDYDGDNRIASVSFEEYNFEKDSFGLRKKLDKVWQGYLERV
jgi:hypothetical protein